MASKRILLVLLIASYEAKAQVELEGESTWAALAGKKSPRPPPPKPPQNVTSAAAGLAGKRGVYGGLTFLTIKGTMYIQGSIANLTDGQHGLHIHESGDVWNSCENIGDHYNPYNKTHTCNPSTGHLGDLGNIVSSNGLAFVNISVAGMTLGWSDGKQGSGNPGVLGLSVAVDTAADSCQATKDGNSGPPLACGVILPLLAVPPPPPPQP